MGHTRPRYNEKGRQAKRQTGKRKLVEVDDSNAEILDEEVRKKRRAELIATRSAEDAPKMSAKKKKRLDAYIERKLKKEERKDLIASLAQSQTSDLSFASSSALGSRQFASQAKRLEHAANVEASKRRKAQRILERVNAGKDNLSDSDGEGEEEDEEIEDGADAKEDKPVEREFVRPRQEFASSTAAPLSAKKSTNPFNPSGAVGVVVEAPVPSSSTSSVPPASAATSASLAKPAPAPPPVASGSALAAGATITVVKRKPKERGRMRALIGAVGKGKGKAKAVDEEEEESSEFDSSDATDSEVEGEEGEEEWKGIEEGEGAVEAEGAGGKDEADSSSDEDGPSGSEDEGEEGAGGEAVVPAPRERGSFRAWADAQVAAAAGIEATPSQSAAEDDGTYKPLLPAGSGVEAAPLPEGLTGPMGAHLAASELPTLPPQRTVHIPVQRSAEIEESRAELPIVKEEDRIMASILGNAVVVLCGETGSGKTTQVGQFLWEAGFDNPGMVAITQPRRVAALSTSTRVRTELGLALDSSLVAHRIRYSSTASPDTKLVFMTDGVLLRELAADFLLSKYSVVVVDEAHERGVNTDVLIGVLSRVAKLRETQWKNGKEGAKPLRLVIMSATLRVSDFAANPTLFPTPPPVLHVTARQHPVTVHFARRTAHDYLAQAYKKVARIHARLPPGGVLVFCTGQNEIVSLCKRLEAKFGPKAVRERKERVKRAAQRGKAQEVDEEAIEAEMEKKLKGGRVEVADDLEAEEVDLGEDKDLAADVDDGVYDDDDEEALESDDEDAELFKGVDMEADVDEPMHILPLYSLLPTDKQMKVFQEPPAGHRLVVVATNVAETAITIPNIKYVVDTGRAKERKYDHASGIQSYEVDWISKASAAQRAGRAGRTGPGHCYRLYSSAVFENHFDEFGKPEILRMPIEGIVLTMKSMNIDSVANFPFPTPPDRDALRRAEKTLVHLAALEASDAASKIGGKITTLGRSMALFPLSPRFAKMIVAGQQHGCLPYVIAIVCALSVGDPFIREANLGDEEEDAAAAAGVEEGEKTLSRAEIEHIRDPEVRAKEERKAIRKAFFKVQQRYAALGKGTSDVFKLLSVVGAYEYEGGKDSFCEANFVRTKAMQEIHKLRAQISRIVASTFPGIDAGFVPKLPPPNETQLKVLRQLLTSAFIDQVAVRKDVADKASNISYAKVASTRGVPYRAFGIDEDLFIHPSSNLFHNSPPDFIVFNELHRTHKVWLKTITKVNPAWLPVLGRAMCTFSKPIETAAEALAAKAKATASGAGEDTRTVFLVPRFGPGVGVELKPVQMTQELVSGRWVLQ
ncbi:putative ATP-dependent RNA helicase DHR1 [Rhodosporidiobolus nylandii]